MPVPLKKIYFLKSCLLSLCSEHGGQQRALYSKSRNYRYLCVLGCGCWDVSPAPSYTHSSFCMFGVTGRGIKDFASVRQVIYHWVISTFIYLWVKIYFILIMLCAWECAHVSAGDCKGQERASDHWSWRSRQSWAVLGTRIVCVFLLSHLSSFHSPVLNFKPCSSDLTLLLDSCFWGRIWRINSSPAALLQRPMVVVAVPSPKVALSLHCTISPHSLQAHPVPPPAQCHLPASPHIPALGRWAL